ncbi:phosphate/phosphite/phosphonate ABC transporter substrate-binding protein [Candidatus Giovannonibacteria bacterium]|nr:phosphate/phosphite/phosphonate ABC transporter substrate-binding protein [Candidatus Giovannonibacteria bacterium]
MKIKRELALIGLIIIAGVAIWIFSKNRSENEIKKIEQETEDAVLTIAEPIGGNLTFGPLYVSADEEYGTFVRYIASKLGDYGIKEGKFIAVQNPYEASVLLRQGKLDIYVDSPFPAYIVSKLTGSEPIVNRWKRGNEKYHSVIFVKKESAIKTPEDLKGKMVAFEKPDSTSAYFLPKAELIKRGFKLTQKTGPNDPVAPDEIGYYFTNRDLKTVTDVIEEKADASAENEQDFLIILKDLEFTKRDDFRFIFQSIDVFRHVFVLRAGMDPKLKEAIIKILVDMDKTPEGQEILNKFKKTKKFTLFEPNADVAFAGIKELAGLVEKEIIGK